MRKASELTAVIKRHLADDELREFEVFFHGWLQRSDLKLSKEIRDTAQMSEDLREALTRAVQAAKREFRGGLGAAHTPDAGQEDGGEA